MSTFQPSTYNEALAVYNGSCDSGCSGEDYGWLFSKESRLKRKKKRQARQSKHLAKAQARLEKCVAKRGERHALCLLAKRRARNISRRMGRVDKRVARVEGNLDGLSLEDYGEYGILGLSKLERSHKKRRQAARKMNRYKRCVAKRGAEHRKCQRILGRAKKRLSKAKELEGRLRAKGKIASVDMDAEGNVTVSDESGNYIPLDRAMSEAGMEGDSFEGESSGGPQMMTAAGLSSDTFDTQGEVAEGGISPVVLLGGAAAVGLLGVMGYMAFKPKKKVA
jgi:hypothetical protein